MDQPLSIGVNKNAKFNFLQEEYFDPEGEERFLLELENQSIKTGFNMRQQHGWVFPDGYDKYTNIFTIFSELESSRDRMVTWIQHGRPHLHADGNALEHFIRILQGIPGTSSKHQLSDGSEKVCAEVIVENIIRSSLLTDDRWTVSLSQSCADNNKPIRDRFFESTKKTSPFAYVLNKNRRRVQEIMCSVKKA
jgi:hypothetical protein